MAVDKNKIIAEATKFVQKGSYDKAIKSYDRILAEDPKDVRILLRVGELHQKKGDDAAAAQAFKQVADTYSEQGFFLKAVAVYKQIVKLDPDDVRVNERLAELYQQLGLMSDAMSQYQLMAAAYEKAGDGARLVDILKRMVELDPDNIASSIKLGELYARSGDAAAALQQLRRAAEHLKRHNRADEYLKVAERIFSLEGEDAGLAREIANIYLAKGDTKRALAKLQVCFKADPKDVETLTLLAQAFRDLGQTSKTASVYKELARVHAERGQRGEARAAWRKVQELVPDDPDAADALGPEASATPTPTPAPMAFGPSAPAMPVGAPRPPRAPGVIAPPPPPPPAAAVARPAPPPPPPPGGEGVAKLLTETDVYVKYGLHDKALDHLRKILAIDPDHADALERMRDLHQLAGRTADAAEAGARAVRACLARGLVDRARDGIARLRQIAPGHPALAELGEGGDGEGPVVEGEELVEDDVLIPVSSAEDDAIALEAAAQEGDEVVVDDEHTLAEEGVALAIEPEPEAEPALDAAGDALAEAAAASSPESDEDVIEEEPAPAIAPAEPPVPTPPPARAASRPPAPSAPASTPRPAPAARAAPILPAAPAPAAVRSRPPDLTDEVDEAEFYLQQGLLDEARDVLRRLLDAHPGHPQVLAKLDELRRREAPPPAPAAAAADEFDIGRELEEELSSAGAPADGEEDFQYSVEDVFNQFKKGVAETVRPEDSDTHYDLGIAYKEMGLLDDALHEFEVALQGANRRKEIDCLSMIALARMAKRDARGAIHAYQRALRCEGLTRETAKALTYELGGAYQAAGDAQAALFFLQRVLKVDAAYRDARERVAALGGGPGRAPWAGHATAHAPAAHGAPAAPAPGRPGPSGSAPTGAGPARAPATPARSAPAPTGGRPSKKNIGYL